MANARKPEPANLTRVAAGLADLRKTLDSMSRAQSALLINAQALQTQIESLSGIINHMVQAMTPVQEQESPSRLIH
jgi:hypothetical protein